MSRPRSFVDVDPRTLRLPTSRLTGADPVKLAYQLSRFGASFAGMPEPLVYRDPDGILMLWDGVTRATRMARLAPGPKIRVEILAESRKSFRSYPELGDTLP